MTDAPVPASQVERPLSPHLQVYKPLMSMMMSIVHRLTGAALFFGTVILAWWLAAAAWGPEAYATFMGVADSLIGRLVLFGYTWALIHHMLGGLRHFIWDSGRGFALGTVDALAWGTLILSVTATLALWVLFAGGM